MLNVETHLVRVIARLLIGIVIFFNLLCAINYLIFPESYIFSYSLSKDTGVPVVQAIGILFVMWNVPYLFALYDPFRNQLSLYESIIMQFIGVIGESWILFSHPALPDATINMINRFIRFDAFGLFALLTAATLVHMSKKNTHPINDL